MPDTLSRRALLALAVLTLLGLFMRLGALQGSVVTDPVRGDAASYFSYAVNLKTAGVYSRSMPTALGGTPVVADATIPPVFPLFVTAFLGEEWRAATLEAVYASIRPVLLAQTLLGALLVPLVFFTGRRLLGTPVALAVAGLAAVSPHLVNINIYLLTEAVFTVAFWLAMWLTARAMAPDAGLRAALAAGAALALAALTRPTVQYLPFLLLPFLLLSAPAQWRRWSALVAIFVACLAAWAVRNVIATGAASDPTAMAATLQHGSYPSFMYNGRPDTLGMPYRFDPVLSHGMPATGILRVILERAAAAPGEYLTWYLVGKPLSLFNWQIMPIGADDWRMVVAGDIYLYPTAITPYAGNPLFKATYLLAYVLHRPLLLLAAAATVVAWLPAGRRLYGDGLQLARLLSLALLYAIGIHMVGAPFPRYSIPFVPLAWLLAGALLAALWRRRQARAAVPATT